MAEDGEQTDDSQKTEEPTRKKLEEARRKGQVALSRELNHWMMLFAGTLVLLVFAPDMLRGLRDLLATFLSQPHALPTHGPGFAAMMKHVLGEILGLLALPLIFLIIAAIAGPYAQIGPLFSTESLKPSLSKISIFKGFGRLFSLRSIAELVKGLVKMIIVGLVGFLLIYPFYGDIEHMIGLEIGQVMFELRYLALILLGGMLAVLAIVAILDIAYQRFEFMKKMRMSKQEIKEEFKQTEGDPHIKARLRQLRQEKARRRMMQAVPEATVVITNPTHFAVALKYEPGVSDAPVCVAKGADRVAFRIREVAEENDVPIVENPPLARTLFDTVDLEEMIPEDQYKAVAEVITYVFRLKGKPL